MSWAWAGLPLLLLWAPAHASAEAGDAFLAAHGKAAAAMRAEKVVHAPVAQGRCEACHASAAEPAKLKAGLSALCLGCHARQKEELGLKVKHKPAADCDACHLPHASAQPALLSEPMNDLCVTCHQPDEDWLKPHFGIIPKKARCTDCHEAHGGGAKGLLIDAVEHSPFSTCAECHLKAGEEGALNLKSKGNGLELCLGCHDDMAGELGKASVHKPFRWGACTECHTPHVSRAPHLINAKTSTESCRQCHKHVPEQGHPVLAHKSAMPGKKDPLEAERDFGCVSCHQPHASEHAQLCRDEGKKFCTMCHEQ